MPSVFFTLLTSADHFYFGYWFSSFHTVIGAFSLYFNIFFWPSFCLPILGFPRGSALKKFACQCRRSGFSHWAGKIPWRRKQQPIPVFLPGKSQGQRSLASYRPWGNKRVRRDLVTKTTLLVYSFVTRLYLYIYSHIEKGLHHSQVARKSAMLLILLQLHFYIYMLNPFTVCSGIGCEVSILLKFFPRRLPNGFVTVY